MEAKELRIGNWYDHNGKPRKVNPTVIEEVWISKRSWCKPIPLTEEILLKCGFEKKKIPGRLYDYYYGYNRLCWFPLEFHDWIYSNKSLEGVNIKHLHQLQNIYFALTQTELKIEL